MTAKRGILLSDDPAVTRSALGEGNVFDLRPASSRVMDPIVSKTFPTIVLVQHCSDCIYCQETCPNLKLDSEQRTMVLNETACKGCGLCIAACPTGAMQQRNSWFGLLYGRVMEQLGQEAIPPHDCNRCRLRVGPMTDTGSSEGPIIRVLCSGRAETGAVLEAVTTGCDGVFVCGCFYDVDFFGKNEGPMEKRKAQISMLVDLLNIPRSQVEYNPASLTTKECANALEGFAQRLAGGG